MLGMEEDDVKPYTDLDYCYWSFEQNQFKLTIPEDETFELNTAASEGKIPLSSLMYLADLEEPGTGEPGTGEPGTGEGTPEEEMLKMIGGTWSWSNEGFDGQMFIDFHADGTCGFHGEGKTIEISYCYYNVADGGLKIWIP
jgi:hypothetical protein